MHRSFVVAAFAATGALVLAGRDAAAADMIQSVTFACDAGKSIEARFYIDNVDLKLSDGRSLSLPQAMSADGARYANKDESFVFWNKGNTAFITEGNPDDQTYAGCILASDLPGTQHFATFASSAAGFSLRYPEGWTVDTAYKYQGLGPGKDIAGVSFTIPNSMTAGNNLADDTRLSVEKLPDATACTANEFLSASDGPPTSVTDAGTQYSKAVLHDAGAGNFYEEDVFAIPGTAPCVAIRYFIHSHNLANFPQGTVTEFDYPKLLATLDLMRRSFLIGQ